MGSACAELGYYPQKKFKHKFKEESQQKKWKAYGPEKPSKKKKYQTHDIHFNVFSLLGTPVGEIPC